MHGVGNNTMYRARELTIGGISWTLQGGNSGRKVSTVEPGN